MPVIKRASYWLRRYQRFRAYRQRPRLMDALYMKGCPLYWYRFKGLFVPSWSDIRTATTSRTITSLFIFTTLVPIAATMASAARRACGSSDHGMWCRFPELPWSWRWLFFAGVFAILSTAIYAIRCPRWVRQFRGIRDFNELGFDSTELYEQANFFFDVEYFKDTAPRFFLYCRLLQQDRVITDVQQDFDQKFREFERAAWNPKAFGLPDHLTPQRRSTHYAFIDAFLRRSSSGPSDFDGTVREYASKHPERFFWRMYRLQDSSRFWSRFVCQMLLLTAYGCLAAILCRNVWFMLVV